MENLRKTNKWRERISRFAPLFLWIGLIFYLSGGGGSFAETSRFIRPFLEYLFVSASPETISFYHSIIRKLAHPTVYAVLGLLAARAYRGISIDLPSGCWRIASLVTVITIATVDEANQYFTESRTGSPFDVLLDALGGLAAVLFAMIWSGYRSSPKSDRL